MAMYTHTYVKFKQSVKNCCFIMKKLWFLTLGGAAVLVFTYYISNAWLDNSKSNEPVLASLIQEDYKIPEVDQEIKNENMYVEKVQKDEIVFVLVICEASQKDWQNSNSVKGKAALTFVRQSKQLEALFKSALIFTTKKLHFIIVTDTLKMFLAVRNITHGWPRYLTDKLRISRRSTWHPARAESMMKVFRPCTVERLFIHEVLRDVDAAVWVDTDTLFLRSPVDLWDTLKSFDAVQMIGLSPSLYWYGSPGFTAPFKYVGKSGINAGVIVMNMTRLRNAPFNVIDGYLETYFNYKKYMYLIDQDILNDFYGRRPEYIYMLGCDWNFRHGICMQDPFPCEEAKKGISLLHGCDMSFFRKYAGSTKAIFEVFLKLGLKEEEIRQLAKMLKDALNHVVGSGEETKCGNVPGFTNMTIHYPMIHFAKSLQH